MCRLISAVVITVTVAGLMAGIVEAQEHTSAPVPTDSASLAKTLNLWAVAAQAAFTSAAIVVGGIFAWRRGYIFRIGQPHLTIDHDVTHRQVSPTYTHIEVTATLHNRSRVKVEIRNGLFTIQQISPTADEDVEYLYRQIYNNNDEYSDLAWDVLDEIPRVWNKDELVAEPGESVTATFEYFVPSYVQSILLTTYFYNSKVMGTIDDVKLSRAAHKKRRLWLWEVSGPRGWTRTSACDMITSNDNLNSEIQEK